MFVIVGLGNPGKKYDGTRHNIGFFTIDLLAEQLGIVVKKIKHKALIGEGYIGSERVLLVKPQTYMNVSGESLLDIMNYYKLTPEQFIVLYDDIDLDEGDIRIRPKGSAGTHNGMKSIIYQLNSDQFSRVRIGIGKPMGAMDLADYVLQRYAPQDAKRMAPACERAIEGVKLIVEQGINAAMNQCNGHS
jgi:PTH1 family peptidyl-tRNA hydrolase